MTTIFNLRAATNATFHWTRDFSAVAAAYAVASGVIRMQARTAAAAADPPAYQWVSGATSGGVAAFDPITAATSPVPLPLSLSATLAATLSPSALGPALATWFATLPTTTPVTAGQWWNDGGKLAQS